MIDINNKKSGETLYNVLLSAATTKTAQRENLYFMKLAREHNTENTEKTKTFKKIFAPFPTDFIESAQRFVCMLFMAQKIFIYFAHRHFTIPNRKKGRRVERKVWEAKRNSGERRNTPRRAKNLSSFNGID